MAGELCPYCNSLLTTSLKFCVNCRRSVTEDKIRQAGAPPKRGSGEDEEVVEGAAKYRLSRKTSYDGVRQARTVFTTLTTLLAITFVYYFTMKFIIHQPIPFEDQLSSIVNSFQKPNQQGQTQVQPDASQPAPAASQQAPAAAAAAQPYAQTDTSAQQAPAAQKPAGY